MPRDEFERLVAEEFPDAIPEEFRPKIRNVAFLVEDEPSAELRKEEGLGPHETLLGHYRGIPHTARGDFYGMGATMPDTITLFQLPIEDEALELYQQRKTPVGTSIAQPDGASIGNFEHEIIRGGRDSEFVAILKQVIRDTIWHELAHHFGMDESAVRRREDERQRGIL